LAPGFVLAQLDSVLEDIPPHAAKLARSVPVKSSRRLLGARPTFLSSGSGPRDDQQAWAPCSLKKPEDSGPRVVASRYPGDAEPLRSEHAVVGKSKTLVDGERRQGRRPVGLRAVLIKGVISAERPLTCCMQMGYFTGSPPPIETTHTHGRMYVFGRYYCGTGKGLVWSQRSKRRRDTSRGLSKPTLVWPRRWTVNHNVQSDAGRGMKRVRSQKEGTRFPCRPDSHSW